MPSQLTDSDLNNREDRLLDLVYMCLETGQSLDTIHIPHSDVFFVRAALQEKFPDKAETFTLKYVESLMRTELGWKDTAD